VRPCSIRSQKKRKTCDVYDPGGLYTKYKKLGKKKKNIVRFSLDEVPS
jgi:hypothetical protein